MLGRASEPQRGQAGSGGRARKVVSSMLTVASAGTMPMPQPRRHCRWWIEPWHSTIASSGKPARWNWPSTFEVKTKDRPARAARRRSTAKPAWGTVRR
jgi:hypothetical protein